MKYKGIEIQVIGDAIPEEEQIAYAERGLDRYGDRLERIRLHICEDNPEEIGIDYYQRPQRFNRIRRITGYLVGDLRRFNDGKRAEEHDRVKHGGLSDGQG